MDTYAAIFSDLAEAYVKVHNHIPDDTTHLFTISSVGSSLDMLPMLAIFQTHGVILDYFLVESTSDEVSATVWVRSSTQLETEPASPLLAEPW